MEIYLTSIGLHNFQTIGSYQEVPFGKITFLYGPNSSGKSAIRDAMEIMLELWGGSDNHPSHFDHISGLSSEKLSENKRRVNDRYVEKTAGLCAEVLIEKDGNDEWGMCHQIKGIYHAGEYVESKNRTKIRGEMRYGRMPSGIIDELLLTVDEELLLHWNQSDRKFAININHQWIVNSGYLPPEDNSRLLDAILLSESNEAGFAWEQGFLTSSKARIYYDSDRRINFSRTYELIEIDHGDESSGGSLDLVNKIYGGILGVGMIYNECIEIFSRIIADGLDSELIKGSRDIPTDEELTYLVNPMEVEKDHEKWSKNLEKEFGFSLKSNPLYAHLATASAIRVIRNYVPSAGLDEEVIENLDVEMERQLNLIYLRPFDFVNEALRDYLFLDKSYQLTSKLIFLEEIEYYFDLSPIKSLYYIGSVLSKLRLIDSTGNILRIDQVGSGIGYVLPILMGVYSSLYSSKFAILEQPELHLHPALQSSLCDVFVDACNKGTRLLIESHSEHILLRALRRVRETSSGRLKTPSLALSADDMVVLYFEPQLNGETKIKRLRVSDDGDFLDRWPNGFFSERDQDLFDE